MLSKRQWTEVEKRNDLIMYKLESGIGVNCETGRLYLIDGYKEITLGRFTNYKELKKIQDKVLETIKYTNSFLEDLEVTHKLRGIK